MTWLMIGQWVLGVAFAIFWSPFTWIGQNYEIHTHVWAAILLGGSLSGLAVLWIRLFPRKSNTRHVVAVIQMLWSALLIHLSGGRIETHFHVFASLAILSIYRDWKVLVSATAVVAIDHFVRGVFYPASVFGIFTESPYRWIEHAAWVLFEVAFLAPGCYRLKNEVHELCLRQCEIAEAKRDVDRKVNERTKDLFLTNQKLKEKTAEAEKLALVAKHTDNGVVITNRNGEIEWINEGFTRITQYSIDEVVGKNRSFLHGEHTCPNAIAVIQSKMTNGEGFDVELINYRKSGEKFWLSIQAQPILDSNGEIVRFIAIQNDVTQRKEMELSLADAEARLRSIINHMPGAFYRRIIGQDLSEKTVFVSDYIKKLTDHTVEEFTENDGHNHIDFIHSEDVNQYRECLRHSLENRCEFECQYRVVSKSNVVRWISEKGRCYQSEEHPDRSIVDGMLLDISEQMAAEFENQQLQAELLDVSRKTGMAEIATGVLHNVGNILNSVNVSASIIRKSLEKSPLANLEKISGLINQHESSFQEFVCNDERGKKVPAYIQKVTNALGNERKKIDEEFRELMGNVEHVKQIVSVQQTMAKSSGLVQEIRPDDLVDNTIAANKSSLERHKIQVLQAIDESVSSFVSDKHRILQILINLVKNAKDSLCEHEIEKPKIRIEVVTEDDFVLFEVSDNGVGISKENLNKIFQHGFTTKRDGHGFGLHSSANAATEIGGSLTAKSNGIGRGATFVLRVPLQPRDK